MKPTKQNVCRALEVIDYGLANSAVSTPRPGLMSVEQALCYAFGETRHNFASPTLRRLVRGLNDAAWSDNTKRAKGLRRLAIAQLGTSGTLDERRFAIDLSKLVITQLLPETLRTAASIQGRWYKYRLRKAATSCEPEWTVAGSYSKAQRAFLVADRAARRALMFRTADAAAAAAATAGAATQVALNAHAAAIASPKAAWTDSAAHFAEQAASKAADAATHASHVLFPADELLGHFAEHLVHVLEDLGTPGAQFLNLTE